MSEQCKKMVYSNDGRLFGSSHQCKRKAKLDGYCTQHHPDNVKARRDASYAKYKAEMDARKRHHEMPRLLREALEEIASGKLNDPVGYAQMKLEELSK